MNTMTMNHISDKVMTERLAALQEQLDAEDKGLQAQLDAANEKLRDRELAHVEELSRVRHQSADPIQTAIDILMSHQQYQDKLTQTEYQRDLFDTENSELRSLVNQLTESGDKLREQVTHYKGECEALLAKHNAEVKKALGEIDRLSCQLGLLQTEAKELRALNPQRQAKQIKELQKKNRELLDGTQALRKTANDNQRIRKEHEERGRVIVALEEENQQLRDAVCTPTSEGEASPMDTLDGWEFYPHSKDDDRLVLLHEQSGTSRLYERGTGFRKLPALPAKIKTRAEEIIANGCKQLEVA